MFRIVRQNIQMVSLFFQGFYPIFSVWHQFHHVTKIIIYRLHFFFNPGAFFRKPSQISSVEIIPRSPASHSVLSKIALRRVCTVFLKIQGSSDSFPECKTSEPARHQKRYFYHVSLSSFLCIIFHFICFCFSHNGRSSCRHTIIPVR